MIALRQSLARMLGSQEGRLQVTVPLSRQLPPEFVMPSNVIVEAPSKTPLLLRVMTTMAPLSSFFQAAYPP